MPYENKKLEAVVKYNVNPKSNRSFSKNSNSHRNSLAEKLHLATYGRPWNNLPTVQEQTIYFVLDREEEGSDLHVIDESLHTLQNTLGSRGARGNRLIISRFRFIYSKTSNVRSCHLVTGLH